MKPVWRRSVTAVWASTMLSATASFCSEIKLAWNDNSANETGFYIERSEAALVFERVATVGTDVSAFIDTNVSPGKEYRYRVSAGNDDGESPYSNIITAVVPVQVNQPPRISQIPDAATSGGQPTGALAFTVGDSETDAHELVVTGTSSNPAWVDDAAIAFHGSDSNRTVTVTPKAPGPGAATITVSVSDGSLSATQSFVVSDAPILPVIADQTARIGELIGPLNFAVTGNVPAPRLTLSGSSSNEALVPRSGIRFGGSGVDRSLVIVPTPGRTGVATITLQLDDGVTSTQTMFAVTVVDMAPPQSRGVAAKQTIRFVATRDPFVIGAPAELHATASSGLPVSFDVVEGNASLTNNVLTLYDGGVVTVRGSQAGNLRFNASTAEFVIANAAPPPGLIFFSGAIGADRLWAASDVPAKKVTLFSLREATGEVLIAPVYMSSDGFFEATLPKVFSGSNHAVPEQRAGREQAAGNETYTVRGRNFKGVLSGVVVESGESFMATAQSTTGPTGSWSGLYSANTLYSVSGTTYLLVGAQRESYILSVGPMLTAAGAGSLEADGTLEIQTTPSGDFSFALDPAARLVRGKLRIAGRQSAELLGGEVGIAHTEGLRNVSSLVGLTGDRAHVLITGFVVAGTSPARVLLRAIGPGLRRFGVVDTLPNPALLIYDRAGRVIAQNDDWGNVRDVSLTGGQVGAFDLALDSLDSALVVTLSQGNYTAQVETHGGDGLVLLEMYDAGEDAGPAKLKNLSTRYEIDTEHREMISGFVLTGSLPRRVMVRAIGPTLRTLGVQNVLSDPSLRVYERGGVIAQNDNWEAPLPVNDAQSVALAADIVVAAERLGAFPTEAGSKDAAIVLTLGPGAYTAEVRGVNNATGTCLLEIYQMEND